MTPNDHADKAETYLKECLETISFLYWAAVSKMREYWVMNGTGGGFSMPEGAD